jgi:hypothetical protein
LKLRESETMTMTMKNLAILALVSQASAFTVVPQSKASLSVSYLLLVEIKRSQAQSLSHPVSFHSSAFRPQKLHALPFDPAAFTESSGLLDKLISLPLDPAGIAEVTGADGSLQVRLMYVSVRKISLISVLIVISFHWYHRIRSPLSRQPEGLLYFLSSLASLESLQRRVGRR